MSTEKPGERTRKSTLMGMTGIGPGPDEGGAPQPAALARIQIQPVAAPPRAPGWFTRGADADVEMTCFIVLQQAEVAFAQPDTIMLVLDRRFWKRMKEIGGVEPPSNHGAVSEAALRGLCNYLKDNHRSGETMEELFETLDKKLDVPVAEIVVTYLQMSLALVWRGLGHGQRKTALVTACVRSAAHVLKQVPRMQLERPTSPPAGRR